MTKTQTKPLKPAIEIKHLSKKFIIPKYNRNSIKEVIVNGLFKNEKTERRVLDKLSFTINKGDFFGIVGRNGSGKSTLLKLIAGVYAPDSGKIKLHGKITPFIELGVGFNMDLSGRDNVFLNGALLGFTRKQIEAMYDEIVAFAELEDFMDLKLKNYSSGMQVRLAFSIAIKAKNDILIFDEVLAVGDEAFQRKCLDVFEYYKAHGQTVVLVTHDMATVKKFCNRAVLIQDGKIIESGNPIKVADAYSRLNDVQIAADLAKKNQNNHQLEKISVLVENDKRQPQNIFNVYDQLFLTVKWQKDERVKTVMVDIFKNTGEHISGFKMFEDEIKALKVDFSKRDQLTIKISLNISPGKYYFKIGVRKSMDSDLWTNYRAGEFIIKEPNYVLRFAGMTPIDKEWII